MNKIQLSQLKKALSKRESVKNASAMDKQLTQIAHKQAAEIRVDREQNSNTRLKAKNVASSFSIAVALTALSFLIMSGMTAVPERELFVDKQGSKPVTDSQPDFTIARSINSLEPGMLATPVVRAQRRLYSADEILQEFSLPTPIELAQSMNLTTTDDRWAVVSSLSSAMADIAAMIGVGELDRARDRYQRLRQSCNNCELPDSLEELALVNQFADENI